MELTTDRLQQQMINSAQSSARYNTQQSQAFAREQMQFQEASNAKAMKFSADQAQLNRNFQQYNSDTAHQREVKDLIKAGLNPVLSSKYGGSSTPSGSSVSGQSSSGASGQVDNGLTSMFNGMLQAIIGQATALQTTSMNNQTALDATRMSNIASIAQSQIGAGAVINSANINASNQRYIQQQQQQFEEYMKQHYPQNMYGAGASFWNSVLGLRDTDGGSAKYTEQNNERIKKVADWWNGLLFRDKEYTKQHN